MKYLRMISNMNHWDRGKMNLYPNCFSTGDILLSDLKTEKNTLSLWKFEDDQEKNDLIVAMAMSRQHIQKLVYVVMDDAGINKRGIPLEDEIGNADGIVDENILKKHVNMAKIDFWRLGYVAEYLCDLVEKDEGHDFVTDKQLYQLIKDRANNGTIDVDQMNESLRASYLKRIAEEKAKAEKLANKK